ncbi:FKBP-type peptidyl-prolyl cis-trans isomerase [Archangium lansingense]|uniref:Peptidyl-prolyl cis-trans isomerase n=1 Tax=Archangium lansingense TaxID=2995310 RepID=A0ABT3ZU52_9BACT|nr:FKBP-type peptidyl-prolyl cis-trans isomerase [Archangium lansinium]MCY1072928.1 FKBP-type peptidyl-prolyl cis-trans isomerase [Archangium lansinium]
MNRLLPILSACLLFAVSACGPDTGDPANVTFASELGVDLAAMQRTDSGLYIQDLVVGTGAEAKTSRYLEVHYTGWLPSGTKFDSSRDINQPFALRLGVEPRVIAGWEEGLVGMKVGGTRKLVIPAELGYGQNGSYPSIPPNSVLVFDVELIYAR